MTIMLRTIVIVSKILATFVLTYGEFLLTIDTCIGLELCKHELGIHMFVPKIGKFL